MSERPTQAAGAGEPGAVTYLDRALWRQLSEAQTAEAFCQSWLVLQSRILDRVFSGLVVFGDADQGFAAVATFPQGEGQGTHLATVIGRALTEKKGVVIPAEDSPADDERLHVAYPVHVAGTLRGIAAFEIAARPSERLHAAMRQLQWGSAWLEAWLLEERIEPEARVRRRLADALDLAALALQKDRFQAAASAFVTDLATRLDCDRVSVGFIQRRRIKVAALSHSAEFGKQMNLIRAIGVAMEESCDQTATLVFPPSPDNNEILRAHTELSRGFGDGAICSVPFIDENQQAYGALTLERSVEEPFDAETVQFVEAAAALGGPILEQKRREDRLILRKIADSFTRQVGRLIGPRYVARKLVVVALLLLTVFFTFAKGRYRVTAPTTLEGEVQRAVVAPYDGFIAEAHVRAGDLVEQGQAICRLDERDLNLEYSKWSSQREQFLLERRQAMANRETAAVKILTERMHQADAQLALLSERLSRTKIVAPFDGLIVTGDLSQALGSPVQVGEVLFEVAPLDAYRVMLEVDESDIGRIAEGQSGELILTALPRTRLPFTVRKITPVSLAEEGRNYFLVEARLDEASPRLRPGMDGFGKIAVDRRRLIWIWTHDAIEWFRLWVWSWWP